MLNPSRALTLNIDSGRALPQIPELEALYRYGTVPRHGQVMMVAGRSGTQKSGFALWYVNKLDVPTLYFSADMSPFTASARVASTRCGLTTEQVEQIMDVDCVERDAILEELDKSKITFAFGSPITWRQVDVELDAYVELHDRYPEMIVFDNLMDFEDAESDYTVQMAVMQTSTELSRSTGSTVMLMHHATDKSWDAKTDPYNPPSRQEIKGGLSEKPELSLSVAIDPHTLDYKVATIKSRMSKCDPTGRSFITLKAQPELTRFHKWGAMIGG